MPRGREFTARCQIIVEYAKWTAMSAAGAGSPIKAKKDLRRMKPSQAFAHYLGPEHGVELPTSERYGHRRFRGEG